MATLTIPLAEFDAVRDDLKKASETIEKLKKELIEVEADKRLVRITKTIQKQSFVNEEVKKLLYRALEREFGSTSVRTVHQRIMSHITSDITIIDSKPVEVKEYINFDDVLNDIRKECNERVATELAACKATIDVHRSEKAILEARHACKLTELKEEHDKELKETREATTSKYDTLRKLYDDLKNDRDTRKREVILEEKIKELKDMLTKEQNRTWLQKLFGTGKK